MRSIAISMAAGMVLAAAGSALATPVALQTYIDHATWRSAQANPSKEASLELGSRVPDFAQSQGHAYAYAYAYGRHAHERQDFAGDPGSGRSGGGEGEGEDVYQIDISGSGHGFGHTKNKGLPDFGSSHEPSQPVPEPGTVGMLGMGLAGLAAGFRRRTS